MPTQKELNDKYSKNLHVSSNNSVIVKRNPAGTLDFTLNENVYIESINWRYDNTSINQYIDTNFSYFKFPPRTIINDVEIPDDTIIVEVEDKIDSLYKPLPQLVPDIQIFLPYDETVNFGWNEKITEDEYNSIKANEPKNPILNQWLIYDKNLIEKGGTTALVPGYPSPPSLTLKPEYQASKYFRAHQIALKEIKENTSNGRYESKGRYGDNYTELFKVNSLIDGHFKTIKFNDNISGVPLMQDGRFIITQDLIDAKKSIDFNIQLAISHLDGYGRNRFIIRLIKYSNDPKNSLTSTGYKIIKSISSIEQGSSAVQDKGAPTDAVKIAKLELDAAKLYVEKQQGFRSDLLLLMADNKKEIDIVTQRYADATINSSGISKKPFGLTPDDYGTWKKRKDDAVAVRNSYNAELATIDLAIYNGGQEIIKKQFTYDQLIKNLGIAKKIEDYTNEDILTGPIYLNPGKTYFTLNYTLKPIDMKLDDIYLVEMLATTPRVIPHEIIEENSFWKINEVSKTSTTSFVPDYKTKWFSDSNSIIKFKDLDGKFIVITDYSLYDPLNPKTYATQVAGS